MKPDIIKEFNLPPYIKNKSFAEASELISKKFDGRTDPHAQKTKEELLERLAEAQEYIKMQEQTAQQSMEQSMNNNAQEVPDEMEGQIPQGMEEFMPQQGEGVDTQGIQEMARGGYTNNKYAAGGFLDMIGQNANADGVDGLNALGGGVNSIMGFGQDLFGKSQIDNTGNSGYMQEKSGAGEAAGGALSGAATGMQIGGPWGAAAGAAIGGVSKLIGANRDNKKIKEANTNRDFTINSQFAPNTFAKGGYTNKYDGGGLMDKIQAAAGGKGVAMQTVDGVKNSIQKDPYSAWMDEDRFNTTKSQSQQQPVSKLESSKDLIPSNNTIGFDTNSFNSFINNNIKKEKSEIDPLKKGFGSKSLDFLNKNKEDLMRLSPVAYNMFRANNLPDAEVIKSQTLDNKYNPQYMDINQMTNQIDQNNVNKALSESSGGNLGALQSSILAANLNKDKAKSQAFAQADQVNRSEDSKKQSFDTEIDKLNMATLNRDIETNMQNRGARQSAKNMLESTAASQIGQIGKEMQDRKIAAEATGYTWDGEFINNSKGDKIDPSDIGVTVKDGEYFDEEGKKLSKKELEKRIKDKK